MTVKDGVKSFPYIAQDHQEFLYLYLTQRDKKNLKSSDKRVSIFNYFFNFSTTNTTSSKILFSLIFEQIRLKKRYSKSH